MASTPAEAAKLNQVHENNTRVHFSQINRGFAGGNNWALQFASGDYILFLNNDTEVKPDFLNHMMNALRSTPGTGAVSPKILRYDAPDIIEYAGFQPMNFYTGQVHSVGYFQQDRAQYNVAGYTNSAHGCAMLIRLKEFNEAGRFCEDYFLYYEEWDFCTRIRKRGLKIWYEPSAIVYHKGSQSIGADNPLKTYYLTRNRILFIRRFAAPHQRILFTLFLLFISIPYNVARNLLLGRIARLKPYLAGVGWNIKHAKTPDPNMYSRL